MSTSTTDTAASVPSAAARSLVSLLGESRAAIVNHLRREGDASVAELAAHLDISEVATRRHLGLLEDEGLVDARTVNQGRGRPAARYQLTTDASRLFPAAYDQLAAEALDFLGQTQGRDGVRAFLRWRLERQVAELGGAVTADDLSDRLDQLAQALSAAGFSASIDADGARFTLTQDHCAIESIARDHPEICAFEAATFSAILGDHVQLRRRSTLTRGDSACVCCVTAKPASGAAPDDGPPVVPDDLSTSGGLLPVVGSEPHHTPRDHDTTMIRPREDAL
ncbi:MAG: ArsR family transcriptional regulator [Nitriliruptor sp.]|uniref:helix-turn-helix transcriptional regulator n=1 Tax=Nitriliruptor sp. TaxID=2448056 RepID=UPI0034A058A7